MLLIIKHSKIISCTLRNGESKSNDLCSFKRIKLWNAYSSWSILPEPMPCEIEIRTPVIDTLNTRTSSTAKTHTHYTHIDIMAILRNMFSSRSFQLLLISFFFFSSMTFLKRLPIFPALCLSTFLDIY